MAEEVSMADFEKYLLEAGEGSSVPAKTLTTARYTIEFAKQESLVADLLRQGYRLSTIHEFLQDKGLVSMPYNSFYRYARKRLGGGIKKHSRKEMEQAVGKAEKADTAKQQAGQDKPKKKMTFNAPSFDNWDGDSRKYIKEWVGE